MVLLHHGPLPPLFLLPLYPLSPCPTGVSAVIGGCPHLTALQLQQCVGPFDVGHMLNRTHRLQQHQPQQQQQAQAASDTSSTEPHKGTAAAPPRRWQLSTLQLSGPPTPCTDTQLLVLLGLRGRVQQQQQGSTAAAQAPNNTRAAAAAVTGSSNSSSNKDVSLPARPLHSRQPSARFVTPHLTALCLVRVNGLTDALLLHLAAAGCHLQHLRLEYCHTQPPAAAAVRRLSGGNGVTLTDNSSSSGSGGCEVASRTVSFSGAALLQLVGTNCSLSLHSLSLRHAGATSGVGVCRAIVEVA